jgi:phosphatase NudJ
VRERKHGQRWYLPAGRVEPGERVVDAARRETLEESGIAVEVDGLLRVEHTPRPDGTARLRVFVAAHPIDDRPPKSVADDESLCAAWVTLDELERLDLRGDEVRAAFEYLSRGGAVHPLALLTDEGSPW